ncbi:MAG: sugar ABC transporter substrate-binding protein [Pseudomonadota bacterium]
MQNIAKAAAAAAVLVAAGPGWVDEARAQSATIVVVSHGQASDPFWSVVKNGVEQAATDMGVAVDYRAPETFDMVAMSQLIDAAIAQSPDGLVVSIPDSDALGDSIEAAAAAGIPVISMNSGADVSAGLGALLHVGQEEFDAGVAAGKALAAAGGQKGICVNHEVGNVALDQRCAGFAEGFGGAVEVVPTTMDPTEIGQKVRAAVEADESIDTVLALGAATVGEPALATLKELGLTGDVRLASFDMSATFLEGVAAGDAMFAIDQQQYLQGYLPVVFLALHHEYGLMPGGNVPSGPNLVTQDKAAQVVDLSAKGIR